MVVMAPKKKTNASNRQGKPIQVYLDDELRKAFERFRSGQRVPPTKTDVAVVAIQEFLGREGYWPPPKE